MNKSDLVQQYAHKNHLHSADAYQIIDTVLDKISDELSKGNRIEIRGFGSLHVKKTDAKEGRNPKTGETVKVPKKHKICYRAGKTLKQELIKCFDQGVPLKKDE